MKKFSAVIALLVAVLFGSLAVMLANRWLSSQQADVSQVIKVDPQTSEIVVAATDINIGTPLSDTNLTLASWPKANQPQGSFGSVEEVTGRVAVTKLVAGEPLLAAELGAPGSGAGLVALIPRGMRAMTIKVDEVIGVAGFVLPNTYVDIIGVQKEQGKAINVKTILKKIKVLAIAQETFTEEGKAKIVRTVTLEVSPDESEKLAIQTHKGNIHLVLRNPLEEEEPEEPVVAAAPAPPPPQEEVKVVVQEKIKPVPVLKSRVFVPAPKPFDVEVIRGAKRTQLQFKNAESPDQV